MTLKIVVMQIMNLIVLITEVANAGTWHIERHHPQVHADVESFFPLAFSPCHGRLPRLKYMSTYPEPDQKPCKLGAGLKFLFLVSVGPSERNPTWITTQVYLVRYAYGIVSCTICVSPWTRIPQMHVLSWQQSMKMQSGANDPPCGPIVLHAEHSALCPHNKKRKLCKQQVITPSLVWTQKRFQASIWA